MYICQFCNNEFKTLCEKQYHCSVECPTRVNCNPFHIGGVGNIQSKKYCKCYRCGRLGHYYLDRECYATTDVDGNDITWGIKCKSPVKFVNRRNYRLK